VVECSVKLRNRHRFFAPAFASHAGRSGFPDGGARVVDGFFVVQFGGLDNLGYSVVIDGV
jgi:hypothetical protein